MKNQLLKSLIVATLLAFYLSAKAEDIDLFVGAPPSSTDVPNVLIILDNTANWSTAFTNEMTALQSVFAGLPLDKFRVGLMMFTETGGGNGNPGGSYVRAGLRVMNATNRPLYANLVNSLSEAGDKGNGRALGLAMTEAYEYYAAKAAYAGYNKVKRDYPSNSVSSYAASNAVYALTGNAFVSSTSTTYVNPVTSGCEKNYIIYIGNSTSTGNVTKDNTSDNSASSGQLYNAAYAATTGDATAKAAAGNAAIAQIPISPTGFSDNMANEWARFMKKSALNITTYSVDVSQGTNGNSDANSALLKSMATISDGKYFLINSSNGGSQITAALNSIFSEIQSANSAFASVSLPVSVNTQGTFLNQVYIGMFRPDQDSFPRWNGNLKQYKLGYSGGVLQLLDADNVSAINANKGFITECARSFWTPSTLDSYWAFKPQGTCATANTDISNTPDGNIVEKGAQGYKLRSTTTRTVKTCSDASCTAMANFNSTAATQALLGAASTAERDALINWQLGLDVDDENINAITTAEMRPSAHGDVVHSRPVAINYGTDAAPQVVVFYGGNDGLLRAVNGNRTANIGSAAAGSELWAFVAPEFYSKIKRIRDNTVTISFPGHTTGTPTPLPKDYGFDGPVTAYKDATNAWIYATMRRGGRALYAINATTPASPTLKWKIGCPNAGDDIGCTSGFTGLGQTWSSPKILKAGGYGSGASPMLIMGGGYDTCQDTDPNSSCSSSSKGTKIYVLDANTGALLKTFNTDSSVVADLTIVPDSNGLIKYAYSADLGGNVYRISGVDANSPIGTTAPGSWTITKIAALGGSSTNNRKFMFPPDILDDNCTYVLLLGSGDREKPLSSYSSATAVANRFFLIKDKPTDTTWLTAENSTCGANVICTNSLFAITTSTAPTSAELATKPKGWYLALASTEQVVTSAITVFGTVTFSTHEPTAPAAGQCTSLGTAQVYNLDYTNAAPKSGTVRSQVIVGGGLPPSPVAGMVTLDNGATVPFIIGANPASALQGGDPPPPSSVVRPRSRVYWNIKK
jgi:type IV pilus assembly protein PilY1